MNKADIQKFTSELGKKSAQARKKRYGKNMSKIMSEIRKGKKMAEISPNLLK